MKTKMQMTYITRTFRLRDVFIYRLVENKKEKGLTLKSIGDKFKISGNRVRQIHALLKRKTNEPERWDELLSVRVRNCLKNVDIETKEQAIEGLKNGTIHPRKIKNYGYISHDELCDFLQLPECKVEWPKSLIKDPKVRKIAAWFDRHDEEITYLEKKGD
jgi:DNA-directed RNA polymerase alpha subunit